MKFCKRCGESDRDKFARNSKSLCWHCASTIRDGMDKAASEEEAEGRLTKRQRQPGYHERLREGFRMMEGLD